MGIGLNLNVIVPANATKDSKLPVAVVSVAISYPTLEACLVFTQWIYGGAFQSGSNAV